MTETPVKKLTAYFLKTLPCRNVVVPAPTTPTKFNGFKTKRKDYHCIKLENILIFLLCITALMVPSLGAVCGVTDGSAANSVACTCGSVECTSTTGFICYSTYGGGTCRKTGFGAFGYYKEEGNTNCGSMNNRGLLPDKAACEAAATSMDLDDVVAEEDSESEYPPGCSWYGSSLRYNTLSTSTASCNVRKHGTSYSDFCLCIAASDCTHTNGATSNTDACLCGGTGCTAASGLYCTSSTSTCSSGDPCTSVDGSSLNTGVDCACGTAACNSFNGMFCYASNSRCSLVAIPDCLTTDGSAANGAACTCRDATCTSVASGLFCYAEASQCSTTVFSNLCPIRDGSAANSVACTCGSVECTSTTGFICYSTYGGGS